MHHDCRGHLLVGAVNLFLMNLDLHGKLNEWLSEGTASPSVRVRRWLLSFSGQLDKEHAIAVLTLSCSHLSEAIMDMGVTSSIRSGLQALRHNRVSGTGALP